jgi:hypothetical protein
MLIKKVVLVQGRIFSLNTELLRFPCCDFRRNLQENLESCEAQFAEYTFSVYVRWEVFLHIVQIISYRRNCLDVCIISIHLWTQKLPILTKFSF